MNWSEMNSDWDDLNGLLLTHWSRLSSHDLETIAGDRDELIRVLQRLYSWTPEAAEGAVCAFEKDVRRPGAVK